MHRLQSATCNGECLDTDVIDNRRGLFFELAIFQLEIHGDELLAYCGTCCYDLIGIKIALSSICANTSFVDFMFKEQEY